MTQRTKVFASLCIGLLVTICISCFSNFTAFAKECEQIRNDIVRIHILANSNTREDQELKIAVRDRVLQECTNLYQGRVHTKQEALEVLSSSLNQLKVSAEQEILRNGYNYDVQISLCESYFTTREYQTFTLPAGYYDALRIEIGEAKGHNWWCIAFPQICLPVAEKKETDQLDSEETFTQSQSEIIENKNKYQVKFAVLEFFEAMKQEIFSWFE